MKITAFAVKFILLCLFIIVQSCASGEHGETAPVTDTKALVNATYAQMDPMKVPYSFNVEKVSQLKNRLDAEADPLKQVNIRLEYAFELLKAGNTAESLKW